MLERLITGKTTEELPKEYEEKVRQNFIKSWRDGLLAEESIPKTINTLDEDLPPTLIQNKLDSESFLEHKTGDIYEDANNVEIYPGEIVDVCLEELDKLKKEYGLDFLTHEFSIEDYGKDAKPPQIKPITNTQVIKTVIELRSMIKSMERMEEMELQDLKKMNPALEIAKLQALYEKNSRFMNNLVDSFNKTIN